MIRGEPCNPTCYGLSSVRFSDSSFAAFQASKRRLISAERITEAVHVRSLAAFTAHGLHHTESHTGILILASLLEHRVVVLADKGINDKVQPGTWNDVVQILTNGLRSGNACDAFCKAIERCGETLAQHFPRSPGRSRRIAQQARDRTIGGDDNFKKGTGFRAANNFNDFGNGIAGQSSSRTSALKNG